MKKSSLLREWYGDESVLPLEVIFGSAGSKAGEEQGGTERQF